MLVTLFKYKPSFSISIKMIVPVTLGCGSSTSQNNSYVENSGAVAGACRYTICKANSNVCQVLHS